MQLSFCFSNKFLLNYVLRYFVLINIKVNALKQKLKYYY